MVVCVGEAGAVGPILWKLVMWEYELEGGRAERPVESKCWGL